jgi:hypothetical protein
MALSSFTNIGSSLKAHWASWLVRAKLAALGSIELGKHVFAHGLKEGDEQPCTSLSS